MLNSNEKKNAPLKELKELNDELLFNDYEYKDLFEFICKVKPDKKLGVLKIIEIKDNERIKKPGVVYVLVIEGRVFKFGHTIRSIKERINGYNVGKDPKNYNESAKFVLETILNLNVEASVYIYFPIHESTLHFLNEKIINDILSPTKRVEKILHEKFKKKYKKLPIGSKVT